MLNLNNYKIRIIKPVSWDIMSKYLSVNKYTKQFSEAYNKQIQQSRAEYYEAGLTIIENPEENVDIDLMWIQLKTVKGWSKRAISRTLRSHGIKFNENLINKYL